MKFYISLLLGLVFAAAPLLAQESAPREAQFFALNQAQVAMSDLGKAWKLYDQAKTVLQELKDEGLLVEFGVLEHAWGDEWNWNIYMVAKDHEAFLKAWNEYITRVNKKYPGLVKDWLSIVKAHKDNLYSLYR